jgi:hypothetical protein
VGFAERFPFWRARKTATNQRLVALFGPKRVLFRYLFDEKLALYRLTAGPPPWLTHARRALRRCRLEIPIVPQSVDPHIDYCVSHQVPDGAVTNQTGGIQILMS